MTAEEFYNRFEFDPSMSGSLLGRGGFGSVHKVYDKVRKRYVAVKRCEVGASHKFDLQYEVELAREISIHPNIVSYENCYRISDRAGAYDYAVMKYYADGNLDDVLKRHDLNDNAKRQILTGILQGLAHLHQIPIIHRDFKTANILVDRDASGNWIPTIADFGLSRLVNADMSHVLNNSQIAHTPSYAAPEQLLDNIAIRPNTDLWAFGVMTYKVVMGRLPFRVEETTGDWDASNKIRSLVLEGKLPADISTIQEPYKSVIRQCLVADPNKRIQRAEDVLKLFNKSNTKAPASPPAPPPPPPPTHSFDGKTKIYPPSKPAKPTTDEKTRIYEEPKILVEPPKPIEKKRFPWAMGLLICSIVFAGGVLYWLSSKKESVPVKPIPEPVAVKSPALLLSPKKEVKPSKDTIKIAAPVAKPATIAKPVAVTQPIKKAKNLTVGYLVIYTKQNLEVYVDNKLQPKIAIANLKNTYEIAAGEGIILKLAQQGSIYYQTSVLTIEPGKTKEVRYYF